MIFALVIILTPDSWVQSPLWFNQGREPRLKGSAFTGLCVVARRPLIFGTSACLGKSVPANFKNFHL